MRWVRATWALLATLSLLEAAPVPKHLMPKEEPYWPTAVGTKWVYDQDGKEMIEEITKAEAREGATRLTVRRAGGGTERDIVDVARDGVTRRSTGRFTSDTRLVWFPLKAGDTWPVAPPMQDELLNEWGKMTVGEPENVTVPAGKFRATKVVFMVTEVDGKPIDKPRIYTYWYANGVGLVRLEWDGGARVLKSFTPGGKK